MSLSDPCLLRRAPINRFDLKPWTSGDADLGKWVSVRQGRQSYEQTTIGPPVASCSGSKDGPMWAYIVDPTLAA